MNGGLTTQRVSATPADHPAWLADLRAACESPLDRFALGDALLRCPLPTGRYIDAATWTGLSVQTLRIVAWTARHVAPDDRHPELSFHVHEAVAALPPDAQRRHLAAARRDGLSVSELRQRIREERAR